MLDKNDEHAHDWFWTDRQVCAHCGIERQLTLSTLEWYVAEVARLRGINEELNFQLIEDHKDMVIVSSRTVEVETNLSIERAEVQRLRGINEELMEMGRNAELKIREQQEWINKQPQREEAIKDLDMLYRRLIHQMDKTTFLTTHKAKELYGHIGQFREKLGLLTGPVKE